MNHSRPAIDITLASAAYVYGEKLLGILLSGANSDGAKGMKCVYDKKGYTIVQDPEHCQVSTMPKAALSQTKVHQSLSVEKIYEFLLKLNEVTKI